MRLRSQRCGSARVVFIGRLVDDEEEDDEEEDDPDAPADGPDDDVPDTAEDAEVADAARPPRTRDVTASDSRIVDPPTRALARLDDK